MNKLALPFWFIFLAYSLLLSQTTQVAYQIIALPGGYPVEAFHNLGFSSGSEAFISRVSGANPAALTRFNRPAAGVSHAFTTTIDSALASTQFKVGLEPLNQLLPASAGVVWPMGHWRLGAGFRQKYAGALDVGEIEIVSIGQPTGTGENYSPQWETRIYSVSGLLAASLANPFFANHTVSIGLQIDLDYLKDFEAVTRTEAVAEDWSPAWKAGLIYTVPDLMSLNLIYQHGTQFEGAVDYSNKTLLSISPDTLISSVEREHSFSAELPDKLAGGFSFQVPGGISLSATLSSVFWSQVADNQKDQLEFSGGIYFPAAKKVRGMVGFYSSNRRFREQFFSDSDYTVYYFSAGCRVRLGGLDITATVMDSHLLSAETRRQTRLEAGIGFHL